MTSESSAAEPLSVLSAWLESHGGDGTGVSADDWQITNFEDALLIAPSGHRRSNRLYLVRGREIAAFSPSVTSFDDAYGTLDRGDN